MGLYELEKEDIAVTLNSLFDDSYNVKPLVSMPACENEFEYEYLLIDMHQWMMSLLEYPGRLYNIDKEIINNYIGKYSSNIFFANLSGSPESIDNRLNKVTKEFLQETEKMYMYFLAYIQECQFKLLELYSINRKTTAVPLLPTSFILNRFATRLYEITEEKPLTQTNMPDKTDYGMNNIYKISELNLNDGCIRTTKDCNIRLYHIDSSARDSSPMTKKWKDLANKLDPNLKSYESRLNMIKKLYTQYMYVGNQNITYTDGSTENIFLLNYPIQTALNMDIVKIGENYREAKFEIVG